MSEKAEKVSISMPTTLLTVGRLLAKRTHTSFSGVVTEAFQDRLESLGLLEGEVATEQESLHRQLDELIEVHGVEEASKILRHPRPARA